MHIYIYIEPSMASGEELHSQSKRIPGNSFLGISIGISIIRSPLVFLI